MPGKPFFNLTISDDGYITFLNKEVPGPGILWHLHWTGWEAFVNVPDHPEPIYCTKDITFPNRTDLANAEETYLRLAPAGVPSQQSNENITTAEGTIAYARTVLMERIIKVPLEDGKDPYDTILAEAHRLEKSGELGLASWTAKSGSEVSDVVDEDTIWFLDAVVINHPAECVPC